jgi:hypothetical protein
MWPDGNELTPAGKKILHYPVIQKFGRPAAIEKNLIRLQLTNLLLICDRAMNEIIFIVCLFFLLTTQPKLFLIRQTQ